MLPDWYRVSVTEVIWAFDFVEISLFSTSAGWNRSCTLWFTAKVELQPCRTCPLAKLLMLRKTKDSLWPHQIKNKSKMCGQSEFRLPAGTTVTQCIACCPGLLLWKEQKQSLSVSAAVVSRIKVNNLGSNTAYVFILLSSEVQAQLVTLSNRIYEYKNVVFGVFCDEEPYLEVQLP